MRNSVLLLLSLLFLTLRLINLTGLPIFNDEAIQMHWGLLLVRHLFDPGGLPLTLDGKQTAVPLLYGFIQNLPGDPLFAARATSALASLVTFFSTMAIAKQYGIKNRAALGILLAACPYLLFFDRLALSESIITACSLCSLFLLSGMRTKPSLLRGIGLGAVIAIGWWFKSTVLLVVPTIVIATIIWMIRYGHRRRRLVSLILSVVVFLILTGPLLFSSSYIDSPSRDTHRIGNFTEIVHRSPEAFAGNLSALVQWGINGLTPIVFLLFVLGVWYMIRRRQGLLLLLFIGMPITMDVVLLSSLTARYIVAIIPACLIISSYSLMLLPRRFIWKTATLASASFCAFLLLFFPLQFYRYVLFLPASQGDFSQYFHGWTSGYGVKEAALWIAKRAGTKDTLVAVRSDSGNPEDAMYVYLDRYKNILIIPADAYMSTEDGEAPHGYFVSRGLQYSGLPFSVAERVRFPKPLDDEFVGVFEITPQTR